MTAEDDRKVMMSVLVDFNSQESITAETERWTHLEGAFMDHIGIEVERLSMMLSDADKSGALNTQHLHKLVWDIAMAYQDYGVAFATLGSLKAFGKYLAQGVEEQE